MAWVHSVCIISHFAAMNSLCRRTKASFRVSGCSTMLKKIAILLFAIVTSCRSAAKASSSFGLPDVSG